ncbi:unnamed protein product, partial [Rotaria sp. Silwood1]
LHHFINKRESDLACTPTCDPGCGNCYIFPGNPGAYIGPGGPYGTCAGCNGRSYDISGRRFCCCACGVCCVVCFSYRYGLVGVPRLLY